MPECKNVEILSLNVKINLALSLENKTDVTVWYFTFHYAINSCVFLKTELTYIRQAVQLCTITALNIQFVFQTKCKITFLHLLTKIHHSYILIFFTSFSVVAPMLAIGAKLNVILICEQMKISALTGKRALKNICSLIT